MREAPLIELEESWAFGMLWPRRLLVYEDRVELHSTELLRETAEVLEYGRIRDVTVGGGAAGSTHLLIQPREGKPLLVRGVDERAARHAKMLIEEGVARAAGSLPQTPEHEQHPGRRTLIQNLTELRDAGILTQAEFETKLREIENRNT